MIALSARTLAFWPGSPRVVIPPPVSLIQLPRGLVHLRDVLSFSEVIAPVVAIETPVRDRADAKVIACAVAGRADFIITGDRGLLALGEVHGIRVATVLAFLHAQSGW